MPYGTLQELFRDDVVALAAQLVEHLGRDDQASLSSRACAKTWLPATSASNANAWVTMRTVRFCMVFIPGWSMTWAHSLLPARAQVTPLQNGVMRFFLLLSVLAVTLTSPARAEWLYREAAIMGTRCTVEVWSTDRARGEAAIESVFADMRPHRCRDEHVQTGIGDLAGQRARRGVAGKSFKGPVRSHKRVDRLLEALARRLRHYLRKRRLSLRYRRHVHPDDAAIAKALPGVDYRNLKLDAAALTIRFERPGMRHRPRRHRQGLLGRPRHRHPQGGGFRPAPWSTPAATRASSATASVARGS